MDDRHSRDAKRRMGKGKSPFPISFTDFPPLAVIDGRGLEKASREKGMNAVDCGEF